MTKFYGNFCDQNRRRNEEKWWLGMNPVLYPKYTHSAPLRCFCISTSLCCTPCPLWHKQYLVQAWNNQACADVPNSAWSQWNSYLTWAPKSIWTAWKIEPSIEMFLNRTVWKWTPEPIFGAWSRKMHWYHYQFITIRSFCQQHQNVHYKCTIL